MKQGSISTSSHRGGAISGPEDLPARLRILETILDHISDGIIVTDQEGTIWFYNRALEQMEDMERGTVLGRRVTDVYDVTPETSEHLTVWRTGKPIPERYQKYMTLSGREVHLVASTLPVVEDGRILAVFSVCRNVSKVRQLLQRTVELQGMVLRNLRPGVNGTTYTLEDIVGRSVVIRELVAAARRAAQANCPVLVYGETGTGKELLAQGIHNAGPRRQEPFVALNCAAIPESLLESTLFGTCRGAFTGAVDSPGLFEQARGGTLYLDEINAMIPSLQAKLLRVLQEKTVRRVGGKEEIPIRCSVISSTNVDPWRCVKEGILRHDLYFRLAGVTLMIPPLRDRKEDIPDLVTHFLRHYNQLYGRRVKGLSREVETLFLRHTWPGNVRELQHTLEAAVLAAEEASKIQPHHLPNHFWDRLSHGRHSPPHPASHLSSRPARKVSNPEMPLKHILRETEREVIVAALSRSNGNVSRAAAMLKLSRQTLQYRMRRLGISGRGERKNTATEQG